MATDDLSSIKDEVAWHFENLCWENLVIKLVDLDCSFNSINADLAHWLEILFEEEEVWETIKGCNGNKAPGLDGFNLNFFKLHWEVVKTDVMKFIGKFYKSGDLGRGVNASFIALIPKVQNPSNLGEYKLISLLDSLYKIVSKTLANRLQKVIGKVIDRNQFAFVNGRQLMDYVLIANEVVDWLKKEKLGGLIFKV